MTTPELLRLAAHVLRATAAVLAIQVAARRRAYRPIAWLLVFAALADLPRLVIGYGMSDIRGPYHGIARLGFLVSESLFWGWIFGIAAVAVRVFLRHSAKVLVVAYAVAVALLVILYPSVLTGAVLNWTRFGLELTAMIVMGACTIFWFVRSPADAQTSIEHRVTLLIFAADLALFAGPYLPIAPQPVERWRLAQGSYVGLYLLLTIIEGRNLWSRSGSPTASSHSYFPRLH